MVNRFKKHLKRYSPTKASPSSNDSARALVIKELKEELNKEKEIIGSKFKSNIKNESAGIHYTHEHARLIDELCIALFQKLYKKASIPATRYPALVAIGGYGRGELAPYSDIDLMFIIPLNLSDTEESIIKELLYILWDLGLNLGHSIRTITECIYEAQKDIITLTSLLDIRFITGSKKLYNTLTKEFDEQIIAKNLGFFVAEKLKERDQRHIRMGESRYQLEPNIKEGKGGLRDLQTLFWISSYLYKAHTTKDLLEHNVLKQKEANKFDKAYKFLWSVRCMLHLLSNRAEERLNFDIQPDLAKSLKYKGKTEQQSAETFMKTYFLTAKEIGNLTRIFCSTLEESSMTGGATAARHHPLQDKKDIDGFQLKNHRLRHPRSGYFKDMPEEMIRIFKVGLQHNIPFHPDALKAISRSLKYIDNNTQTNKDANLNFMDILLSPRHAEECLKKMNESGVLGAFIPEFQNIIAHMQYDMYHVYTVDEHLLHAVGKLHKIENKQYSNEAPLSTKLFQSCESRKVLYVAILLHDIAKGSGKSHAIAGEEIAQKLCPRLGLNLAETETVCWLVRNHLLMSNIAFQRDLSDPQTIQNFVDQILSPERLKLLLILTTADIMAVGPNRWNSWKANLLEQLYHHSFAVLTGTPVETYGLAQIEQNQQEVSLACKDNKIFQEFLSITTDYYWLSFSPDRIIKHLETFKKGHKSSITITILKQPEHDVSEVIVYTQDRKGLFSILSGALASSGANIVEARIFTLRNAMAFDIFRVQNLNAKPIENEDRLEQKIKNILKGKQDIKITERKEQYSKKFNVPHRVIIQNDESKTNTVIEINGKDRPGLLYDLTSCLTGMNLQISAAKVTTVGSRAIDVFYIRDNFGLKIINKNKIKEIRETLLQALNIDKRG